jgi:hypothetical protein
MSFGIVSMAANFEVDQHQKRADMRRRAVSTAPAEGK